LVSNNENLPDYNRKLFCKNDNEFFVLGGFWNKKYQGWKDTLFYTNNSGQTWDTLKNMPNMTYENIVSRNDKNILYADSKYSYFSDDNFKTFKYLGDSTLENPWELGLSGLDIINENYAIASTYIQGMVWLLDMNAVGVYTPIYLPPIMLYPNPLPLSSSLNIRLDEFENYPNLNFKIININGRVIDELLSKVEQQNILLQYTPDNNVNSGIYFLVIQSGGKIIAKEKFVIE
jgi:hypothetical protein